MMHALPLDAGVSGMDHVPLLSVDDLHVTFSTRNGLVKALRGVNLEIGAGETLGIVGESGSGKSVTAYAATRLLDSSGRITQGQIRFRGENVARLSARSMRALHGAAISMIFQNPRAALNPIRSIGQQIADVLLAHKPISGGEARQRALDLLKAVLIRDPEKRLGAYPHELSGGMCQRVMIAMAIACEPALLIADEPTTGLDVTTQKTVMDLLADITAQRGMSLILITHDLGLAARYCRRVCVMEQGQVVEAAEPIRLFRQPAHAYTRRLVAASPTATSTIADLASGQAAAPGRAPAAVSAEGPGAPLLLEVQRLVKRYPGPVVAVDDVSFSLRRGESLGLVGESGSGKTTLSRMVARLIDQSEGEILFDGNPIGSIPERDFHKAPERRDIQLVFQDPTDSLNPRFNAFDSIAHPLVRMLGMRSGAELTRRVVDCAVRTGLDRDLLERFPHQLSGGQKARVGIARAVACNPRLLILDEPTAALDVSVQAVILQLLDRLRREDGMACLFVSHDLNVVRMMCERTIVLQNGKIVEQGESQRLLTAPEHDYTRTLVAAIPHFEGRVQPPV